VIAINIICSLFSYVHIIHVLHR